MSQINGTDTDAADLSRFERFLQVIGNPLNRREPIAEASERPLLSESDERALLLAGWASKPDCRDHFLPFLGATIREANALVSASIPNHAHLSYAIGRRDALVELRRLFHQWAGTDVDDVSADEE